MRTLKRKRVTDPTSKCPLLYREAKLLEYHITLENRLKISSTSVWTDVSELQSKRKSKENPAIQLVTITIQSRRITWKYIQHNLQF